MTVNNSLQARTQKTPFSVAINSDGYKKLINNTLRDQNRANRFVASIVSAVSINPQLQECEPSTIISAALLGESLNLSPSPQLGQFYMVPFKDKNRGTVAQFQLGYKGYTQLAIRSGQYKKLNVLAIKEGELINFDPLNEEIEVNLIQDETVRENTPTKGYYAMFMYTNGFKKAMYWSKEKMESHALKYSQGYAADKRKGTNWTFWSKDFDGMAMKTMLRQLISKWGIMSVEMQKALISDSALIKEDMSVDYVDNKLIDIDDSKFVDTETTVLEEHTAQTPEEISQTPFPPQGKNNAVESALFG